MLTSIDSLVSSQIYEIIKTIYTTTPDAMPNPISTESQDSSPRIKVLQSALGQLRLNNIATLDALMTHFTRLIDLTSADEEFVAKLATVLAPCILRPKQDNALSKDEKFAYRLIRDLFDHKEGIFGELKRQSSNGSLGGGAGLNNASRARAVSNADESNRRANMEARAKAINDQRQREKSPAPFNRHKREVSTGRFPVVASPRPDGSATPRISSAPVNRTSLDVPGSQENSPEQTATTTAFGAGQSSTYGTGRKLTHNHEAVSTNGDYPPRDDSITHPLRVFSGGGPGPHIPPPAEDDASMPSSGATDQKSETASLASPTSLSGPAGGGLKRSALGSGGKRLAATKPISSNIRRSASRELGGLSLTQNEQPTRSQGVTLEDKPMDD